MLAGERPGFDVRFRGAIPGVVALDNIDPVDDILQDLPIYRGRPIGAEGVRDDGEGTLVVYGVKSLRGREAGRDLFGEERTDDLAVPGEDLLSLFASSRTSA